MQYAPTYTNQKFDSHLLDESQTRQVLGCMLLRPTPPQRETLKICMDARKTRRGLDENGHIHRKPGGDWTKMAISIENPAGIRRIWPYLSKTRRGLDENGHIHRKPGGDWTNMTISIENPAGIGRKWPYLLKTRRELDENGHIYRKPAGNWTNMAISIENPAGIGFNMDTAIESSPGTGFHTFSGILFWARMGFMYPYAGYTYSIWVGRWLGPW